MQGLCVKHYGVFCRSRSMPFELSTLAAQPRKQICSSSSNKITTLGCHIALEINTCGVRNEIVPPAKLLTAAENKPQFSSWLILAFDHITRNRLQKMNMKRLYISFILVNIQLVTLKILFKDLTYWSLSYIVCLTAIFFSPVYFTKLLSVKLSAVDTKIYS